MAVAHIDRNTRSGTVAREDATSQQLCVPVSVCIVNGEIIDDNTCFNVNDGDLHGSCVHGCVMEGIA